MILVCGTKRSGTSMWMQLLASAGYPAIGQRFPRSWGETALRAANPEGFYESSLREGINFLTNPDSKTGEYLYPADTVHHVVKVFLPGLVRSDLAFLHRVIITVRDWRKYAASVARLGDLESRAGGIPETARPPVQPALPHALEWWAENFIALRDVMLRRYPCHVLTYESVLANPGGVVEEVLQWLGGPQPNLEAAVAVVSPELSTVEEAPLPDGVDPADAAVFDELYLRIHEGRPFDASFVERLNQTHARLTPSIYEHLRGADLGRRYQALVQAEKER